MEDDEVDVIPVRRALAAIPTVALTTSDREQDVARAFEIGELVAGSSPPVAEPGLVAPADALGRGHRASIMPR